eukprot:scaffold5296_cov215-Cylindrotheca_fusiformis.AAC.4
MNLLLSIASLLSLSSIYVDAFAAKKAKPSGLGFGASSKDKLSHTPDTSESTQALLKFLTAQKSKGLTDVEIGTDISTGVRGLFAAKNFKNGQIMCQIPSDCALALSDPQENGEDAPTLAHGAANFLSLYWNNEQARKLWAPYLDTLPVQGSSQFDPTPDFFTDEELNLLEFPRIIRQAKNRKEEIAKLAAEKGMDIQELQFATWLTASRAFAISMSAKSDEEDKVLLEADSDSEEATEGDKLSIVTKAETKTIRVMVPFIGKYWKITSYNCVGSSI